MYNNIFHSIIGEKAFLTISWSWSNIEYLLSQANRCNYIKSNKDISISAIIKVVSRLQIILTYRFYFNIIHGRVKAMSKLVWAIDGGAGKSLILLLELKNNH